MLCSTILLKISLAMASSMPLFLVKDDNKVDVDFDEDNGEDKDCANAVVVEAQVWEQMTSQ